MMSQGPLGGHDEDIHFDDGLDHRMMRQDGTQRVISGAHLTCLNNSSYNGAIVK